MRYELRKRGRNHPSSRLLAVEIGKSYSVSL
jgi:hypothetical protein